MHAYPLGGVTVVVGQPASALVVPQSLVADGTAGSVTTTGLVAAVDRLVLKVVDGALFDEHADATTRTTQADASASPMHRRPRT